jgi:BlaI family transcriptional regulator, penicillinase repressor
MPRPTTPTLTDAELRLMQVLWDRGPVTAGDIVGALPKRDRVADSTVRTILRILEDKGYVRHTKQGRAFVYHPVVAKRDARRTVVRHLIDRFFNASPELLVLNVLEHEAIDDAELARLRRRIDAGDTDTPR